MGAHSQVNGRTAVITGVPRLTGADVEASDLRAGAALVTAALRERLARADVILFDGTLYTDDEMIRTGTGEKTGRRMGHMPIEGEGGSLAALADMPARRIFVHINNTNPILVDGSPERAHVEAAGWEVATDGMEIVL
jgi:pyrroloquinoline quinone biosynthesis protein B